MNELLLSLVALGIIAFAIGWLHHRSLQKKLARGEISSLPKIKSTRPEGCCGLHEFCEKESLLTALSKGEVEYYDDEELDAFRCRPSNSYTPQEVSLFEEVLTTMREEEVAGWMRSLQLRGIELPDELKDEVILIVGERRTSE